MFYRAVIAKYHKVGVLTNRNLFFHKSQGVCNLVSPETSLHTWQTVIFFLCPHMGFCCVPTLLVSPCLLIRTLFLWIWAPPFLPHLNLITILKTLSLNIFSLWFSGMGFNIWIWEGHIIHCITSSKYNCLQLSYLIIVSLKNTMGV